jgi:hypothetical protein
MVIFQQPLGSLRCGRIKSPCGLKQFALQALRFAKDGYRRPADLQEEHGFSCIGF